MGSGKSARSESQRKRIAKTAPAPAAPAVAGLTPVAAATLPAIIGAELAHDVAIMQNVLQEVRSMRSISRGQVATLEACLESAHRIAMQSQQISRLASGRLRQSHERLPLDTIVNDVLNGMTLRFKLGGYEVTHRLRPVEVIVDPGLLLGLVQVAIDWSADQGQRLQVRLDVKNWPEHAELAIKSSQSVALSQAASGEEKVRDDLNWQLLLQTAMAMGVTVDRVVAVDHTMLSIEFPRTVRQIEGLMAIDMESNSGISSGHSSTFLTEARPLAGHRVLLVSADAGVIGELKAVCDSMGLTLDVCPTSAGAVRHCEADMPHLIVVEERLRDHQFEELRADIVRSDVNFPVVEITRAPNILEMSNWMGDSVSRISRDSLRAHLPSFLVMELAKIG
ncbi:hypothetical protein [Caenimonas sp. SL110]|uniref:hypothetical protein n=1 Tax=Caenimonas sp. SL110 TaxID=1450524 RepID=UPI000652B907|nr:hypothetical protein [Caenimonas sp. SL110]